MKKDKSKKEKKKNKKKKLSKITESSDNMKAVADPKPEQSEKKEKKKKKGKKKEVLKTKDVSKKPNEKNKLIEAEKAPKKSTKTVTKAQDGMSAKDNDSATAGRSKRKTQVKSTQVVSRAKLETMLSIDEDAPTDITSIIASATDALYVYFSEPYTLKDGSTLSPAEVRTLSFVCDQGGVTLTMIALDSGATKSAVTKPVNRLIEKNMLVRKPMPGNGREKLIVPTEKGKASLDEMKIMKTARLGKLAKLEENLSDSQIEGFKKYLKALFTL